MSRLVPALALLALLGSTARADKKADAKKIAAEATTDFKLGRFDAALEKYSRAYEIYPAPGLLFNLGQCHRNLKNHERAVFFFTGFLRENPDAANRPVVEELLAEEKAALAADEKARADDKTSAEARTRADEERARADAERARADEARLAASLAPSSAPAPRREPGLTEKWWFWAAAGAAVIVVGSVGIAAATAEDTVVLPAGTLPTLDWR